MKVHVSLRSRAKLLLLSHLYNRIIYNINSENGAGKKPAHAKSRTTRFVKITVNYGISAVPEFILVTSMHIHNAIQTNYAHKGICGGS